MSEPNEIVRTSRQVIEKKLLTALGEGSQVAVLCTEDDIELLALACEYFGGSKADGLAAGFRQLQREAFPNSVKRRVLNEP